MSETVISKTEDSPNLAALPLQNEPPAELEGDDAASWRRLRSLIPAGVAKQSDLAHLVALSTLYTKLLHGRISDGALAILTRGMAKMGLTPEGRAKLGIKQDEPDDEFAEFR